MVIKLIRYNPSSKIAPIVKLFKQEDSWKVHQYILYYIKNHRDWAISKDKLIVYEGILDKQSLDNIQRTL